MPEIVQGTPVLSRDGLMLGTATGNEDHDGNIDCGVDDCRSLAVEVEWPDGQVTWICPAAVVWLTDGETPIPKID